MGRDSGTFTCGVRSEEGARNCKGMLLVNYFSLESGLHVQTLVTMKTWLQEYTPHFMKLLGLSLERPAGYLKLSHYYYFNYFAKSKNIYNFRDFFLLLPQSKAD